MQQIREFIFTESKDANKIGPGDFVGVWCGDQYLAKWHPTTGITKPNDNQPLVFMANELTEIATKCAEVWMLHRLRESYPKDKSLTFGNYVGEIFEKMMKNGQ